MNSKEGSFVGSENGKVSFEELSFLTGFPIQFIKDELAFKLEDEISLEELRTRMLKYLDKEMLADTSLN